MESMLKQSLITKYQDECRQIAGNEQVPVEFSKKEVMTKYDPDRVQTYFIVHRQPDDNTSAPMTSEDQTTTLTETIKKD